MRRAALISVAREAAPAQKTRMFNETERVRRPVASAGPSFTPAASATGAADDDGVIVLGLARDGARTGEVPCGERVERKSGNAVHPAPKVLLNRL